MATTGSEQYVGNLLSLMSTLMENKRAKQEAKESRMFDLGMAQWYQQAQSAQQMDQMRLQSALEQDARLEDRRAELLAKVGHVSEVNKALETITDRTPATTGLLSKELEAINREHETIASQREEYAGVIAGLQARSTARQKEIDTLLGYMSWQEAEQYEQEFGLKKEQVGAQTLGAQAGMLSAQAAMLRAQTEAGAVDSQSVQQQALFEMLGKLATAAKGNWGVIGEEPVLDKKGNQVKSSTGVPQFKKVYGYTGGSPEAYDTATQLMQFLSTQGFGGEPPVVRDIGAPWWQQIQQDLSSKAAMGDPIAKQRLERIKQASGIDELLNAAESGDEAAAKALFYLEDMGVQF